MKLGSGICLGVVAAVTMVVVACRTGGRDQQGTQSNERAAKPAALLETISGEVVETAEGGRGRGDGKGGGTSGPTAPLITVRSAGETIRVHAGPPWFHKQIGLALAVGDRIEVTGKREGQPGQPVLFAETIKTGDKTFRVRDENGEKLWRPKASSELPVATISGKVVDLAPELAEHAAGQTGSGNFIAVETDQGKVAVQLGPEPFRTQQGLTIALGDAVEISGWRVPGASLLDTPLMLAATIQKGTLVVRLRDEKRLPLWPMEKKADGAGRQ
jgi:hypothetical protein